MKLSQASNKLAKTTAYGFNSTTLVWDVLPFKISYPPDGRFIGRNVAFYDRRIFITPEELNSVYAMIKIGVNDSEALMVYASQENIHNDETYLYSHTGFNIQGYAQLYRLVSATSASGMKTQPVKTLVGNYPIALEKGFSGPQNLNAAGVYNTRLGGYTVNYSGIKTSDILEFDGDVFTVDEVVSELRLKFIQLTKR